MDFEPVHPAHAPAALVQSAEISVLTYNVKGLPWPIARGRGEALREIGRELAALRREGREPDVVLIQEGFRAEIADLVRESGYRYWAKGPSRGLRNLTGGGLHVLSDEPIVDVKAAAFRNCAGLDCLANKGAMLVRLAPEGLPTPVDVINTHMNARKASRAPRSQTLPAHQGQTRELFQFIKAHREPAAPMVVGGDFNIRNSPDRYYYQALERPYTVVGEFCHQPEASCGEGASDLGAEPWLRRQDLQAFQPGAVHVQPVRAEMLFTGQDRPMLSDHEGYLVLYRLSWSGATLAAYKPAPGVEVKPQFGRWGVKVAWKR
jgi:endonuclease/exonuclease/phosphatase family metal-dependent hydrolase